MTERVLRAGVIGLGAMGSNHVRVYGELRGVELVAVADIDEGRVGETTRGRTLRGYADYRRLLEEAGFTIQSINLIPRPTPLPNGMESWLNTFRNGVLDQLPPQDRATALAHTVALLEPILRDADGNWTADYVRLRFHATRDN